jgi:hypothetical protein
MNNEETRTNYSPRGAIHQFPNCCDEPIDGLYNYTN